MMAFLCLVVSALMILVVQKGQLLRRYSLIKEDTEDGVKVFGESEGSTKA